MLEAHVGVALAEVPVNSYPLIDDTDFKTREVSVAFDASGMDLVWNFFTPDGAFTQTAVTPTSGGVHDWTHQGDGMYTIEIPASGGTINNDAVGIGWFTGFVTGVLPWSGPMVKFGIGLANVTTIASLASQVSFTLTAGSADDDAYNGWLAVVRDATGSAQVALGIVSDYTGSSKTVTLEADPGVFTMAVGDYITLVPQPAGLTVAQAADVNAEADTALSDYDPPTRAELTSDVNALDTVIDRVEADTQDIQARLPATLVSGRIDAHIGSIADAVLTAAKFAAGAFDAVWSVATRILTAATNITSTGGTTVPQTGDSFARIGATGSGLTSLAQASVATEARLAELDAGNLPADVDTLLGRVVGTLATGTHNPQSGDAYARLGAPAGASVSADIAENQTDLNTIITQRSVPAKNSAFSFDFKMVDATDFATPETGLTVTAQVSKDGAAFANAAGIVTEIANGMYQFAATAADMNANKSTFRFTASGAAATVVTIITDGGV